MKFFIKNSEKTGTCYHEFYKGKWDGSTFWKEDSLLIHDDVMFEHRGFVEAIKMVVPHYDPYKETEINKDAWIKIGNVMQNADTESKEVYYEANAWIEQVFLEHDCFTILGL